MYNWIELFEANKKDSLYFLGSCEIKTVIKGRKALK